MAGLPVSMWCELFFQCHALGNGVTRLAWPDGGTLLEQEEVVVRAFDVIKTAVLDLFRYEQQQRRRS